MQKYDPEQIKSAVSMEDALRMYHHLGRHKGRTSCPIHGGKHDNLGYNETSFHCFVCGASGDVISFVRQLFDLGFKDALKKLADDFGLPCSDLSPDELYRRRVERERVRAAETARKQKLNNDFTAMCKYRHWLVARPPTRRAVQQLAELDRLIDRMIDGNFTPDYDMRAMLYGMYKVLEAEEDNGNCIIPGVQAGANA